VLPRVEGAVELDVDESPSRLPDDDAGSPANGYSVQAERVVDDGVSPHRDGIRCEDAEAKPRRGDRLEVAGVGEERERIRERDRHEL
jgi:hypothetical protein